MDSTDKERKAAPMPETDQTKYIRAVMPLCETLEQTVVEMSADKVVLSADWAEKFCTTNSVLHGGYLMAFADSAGAICASLNLPEGAGTSTIESKTNFLGAVRGGTVFATSRPLHVGGTTIVVETDITRDDGKLVARVTQTQIVLRPQ